MDWALLSAINTCNVCFIHTGQYENPLMHHRSNTDDVMNMNKDIAITVTE